MASGVIVVSNLCLQVAQNLTAEAAVIVRETAEELATDAKRRAPVDTGRLRDSIHAQMTGPAQADVGTDVEYGIYQEFGTHKMAAHPFLVPAAEAARPTFVARIKGLTG